MPVVLLQDSNQSDKPKYFLDDVPHVMLRHLPLIMRVDRVQLALVLEVVHENDLLLHLLI